MDSFTATPFSIGRRKVFFEGDALELAFLERRPAALLGDYLAEWLEGLGDELAPLTRSTYSAVVRTHICSRPWLARKSLQAVTGADVRRLESEQQGSSAATRTLTRAVLSRALTDAVAIGKLMRNPAAQIKRRGRRAQANGTEPNAKAWTTRELARFLEHVDDDRLYALSGGSAR